MIKTRLTERLDIDHPIVLGGMGTATNVDLVVAVCEAGGLGILGVTSFSPDQIAQASAEIRKRTKRPFGLNLLIAFTSDAQLDACLDARVPVLSTAWGDPTHHAQRAKQSGVPWMHMVQSAAAAATAAQLGASVVVAQGHEGGGHVGLVSTMPLVPAAVDAIIRAIPNSSQRPPVVAAGGIADGRGLVAALSLGADGVLLGTRFLATTEAPVPQAAKDAICAASESDTICNTIPDLVSNPRWLEIGALARGLRTLAVMEWVGREKELKALSEEERKQLAARWVEARSQGRIEETSVLAGEDSGLISEVLPAGQVVTRTVAEAEQILRAMGRFLS